MIQPFISGTAYNEVMASREKPTKYPFQPIDNPLLSVEGVLTLMEHYAKKFNADNKWKLNLPFLILLTDMGGLPRAIQCLLEECFGKDFSKGKEFFEKLSGPSEIPLYEIFNVVANSIKVKYGIPDFIKNNQEAALEVLNYSLRNVLVEREQVLGNLTISSMEQSGYIFLHEAYPGELYFRMPFIFLDIYNQYFRIIPPDELYEAPFNHNSEMSWEKFNALFQVFMINLFCKKEKNYTTLGEFYNGAEGHDDTKNLCIAMDPPL
jgi:hypothetical protein